MFKVRNGGFFLKRLRVAVLYGGRSSEHEVSLRSAYSVIKAMDQNKYEIIPIGITKDGKWITGELAALLGTNEAMTLGNKPILISPDPQSNADLNIDVIFPVMHGTNAEDGIIQGLFELAQIPYVGCDVASSVLAFDKALTKTVISLIGLEQAKYVVLEKNNYQAGIKEIEEKIGYPCFVKPARQGSSVGISKVLSSGDLEKALKMALNYDTKVVVEEFVQGRELEISVLGNKDPEVSLPGEIVPGADFYDYEAKYITNNCRLDIPAKLSQEQIQAMQQSAISLYRALGCKGLARVDFFLTQNTGKFYINEINTMPGFTSISMYPKLWEVSGLPYSQLIDKLITLALER